MGAYDFTYEIPNNFNKRIVQYLQQIGNAKIATAFMRCKYEYEKIDLAYYAGIRGGDTWDKYALDFTFEGMKEHISILQASDRIIKSALDKALKPNESGFLVRNVFYFDNDVSFDDSSVPASNEDRLNADLVTARSVLSDLIQIGERVCLNPSYNASSSENTINDCFRDMLFMKGYDEVKDQTRHGISTNAKDAGEVDILLTKDGREIAIFEGLKLDSVHTSYIDTHIDKAITNYNALGTATFIVAYVNCANFESFWDRYSSHIENYVFPIKTKTDFKLLPHPNAAARVATQILSRDGYDFPVYFIAFKIG